MITCRLWAMTFREMQEIIFKKRKNEFKLAIISAKDTYVVSVRKVNNTRETNGIKLKLYD